MRGRELRFRPGARRLSRLYFALFGNPNLGEHIRSAYFRHIIRGLDLDGQRILDAGCGWGPYSYYLARRFPHADVEGCDLLPATAERNAIIARRLGLTNLRFFTASLDALDVADRYGFILCIDVLEHIPNDAQTVVNLGGALRPGGLLYLHAPRDQFRPILSQRFAREAAEFEEHVRHGYRQDALVQLARDAGLEVLKAGPTWRWWAELLWELNGLGSAFRPLRALTAPLLRPFISLDLRLKGEGRGVYLLARKPDA